jgi:hypothetical protein
VAWTDAAVKDGQGYSVGNQKIIEEGENWQGDAKAEGDLGIGRVMKWRSCLVDCF